MLAVHGTFPIRPDAVGDLQAALGPLQSATRQEPGCVFYDWAQSVEQPGTFYSVEVWRSREDLDAHMTTDHVATALTGLPDMLAGQPQLIGYDGAERIELPL